MRNRRDSKPTGYESTEFWSYFTNISLFNDLYFINVSHLSLCFIRYAFHIQDHFIILLKQEHIKVLPVQTISKLLHFRIFIWSSLSFFDLLTSFQFSVSLFQPIFNRGKHIVHRIIFNLVRYQMEFRWTYWKNDANWEKNVKKVHFLRTALISICYIGLNCCRPSLLSEFQTENRLKHRIK